MRDIGASDSLEAIEWFDELALDPRAHPVAMGTRALGHRPWLVADDRRDVELAIKADLLSTRREQVLHTTDDSVEAATQLAQLIGTPIGGELHPIEEAARSVQEDLCLLQRRASGWHLDASCLCFPTRWHLQDKVGQHIALVHGPVRGYDPLITGKVDQMFDRLSDRPVWRRNWFLMTDTTLFQPDRPPVETIIDSDSVLDDVFIRSERQTLRRLADDWIVFTIRVQQECLGELLTTDERRRSFRDWAAHVSHDFGARRHLTPPQRTQLLAGLDTPI
jgi:hypothetical protein